MQPQQPHVLEFYRSSNGRVPFEEWLSSIPSMYRKRIMSRLTVLESGSFGDYKSVGGGFLELRCHFGKGYRIYCRKAGKTVILLLCGGDKSSKSNQTNDIRRAREFWQDHLSMQREKQ